MNKLSFFLDKPNSSEPSLIFLRYICRDEPLKYTTKEKVIPVDWNPKTQRTHSNRNVNRELDRFEGIIERYAETCRIFEKPVYKSELRTELNTRDHREEKKATTTNFFIAVEAIIREAKDGTLLTPQNKKYSIGSIKNWEKSKRLLLEFNKKLDFHAITIQTYYDFINWCNDTKNYSLNYTGVLIKDWKTFLTITQKKGYHNTFIHKHADFKQMSEKTFEVYLNEDEILMLYQLDLTGNKMKEIIRDRFVINLYNGLRISDMKSITLDNFSNGTISQINKKTDKKVVIPVHYLVNEIIEKYNGELPRQYHENVVNRQIKEIAKMAGLDEMVYYTKTVGGKTYHIKEEKYKLISNHTCRRSAATNLLKHTGVVEAMPVMGMSLKTLTHYNRISAEENAAKLKNNSYYQKPKENAVTSIPIK